MGWLLNYQRMTFANSFICKQFPGAIYIVTATTDTLQKQQKRQQQQQHGGYDIAEDVDDVAGGQTDGLTQSSSR